MSWGLGGCRSEEAICKHRRADVGKASGRKGLPDCMKMQEVPRGKLDVQEHLKGASMVGKLRCGN